MNAVEMETGKAFSLALTTSVGRIARWRALRIPVVRSEFKECPFP